MTIFIRIKHILSLVWSLFRVVFQFFVRIYRASRHRDPTLTIKLCLQTKEYTLLPPGPLR